MGHQQDDDEALRRRVFVRLLGVFCAGLVLLVVWESPTWIDGMVRGVMLYSVGQLVFRAHAHRVGFRPGLLGLLFVLKVRPRSGGEGSPTSARTG